MRCWQCNQYHGAEPCADPRDFLAEDNREDDHDDE